MTSHYPNQCWNFVNWTLGNKLQWNRNKNFHIFIQENAFQYVVCKMAAILPWLQWVDEYGLQVLVTIHCMLCYCDVPVVKIAFVQFRNCIWTQLQLGLEPLEVMSGSVQTCNAIAVALWLGLALICQCDLAVLLHGDFLPSSNSGPIHYKNGVLPVLGFPL